MTKRAVVVGGGVGGLATAIRLQAGGRYQVTLLERAGHLGGKLGVDERDGFSFDTGPSLVTLPHIIEDLFALGGSRLADHVDLVRLDPQFRYRWRDGTRWEVRDDPAATAALAGVDLAAFLAEGARMWDVSERTFFAGPMSNPISLIRRMRSPRDLTTIRGWQSLDSYAQRHLGDERLVQWAGRYATYSGSSPFKAPATLACIPAIEARYGCWYPKGGLGRLRDAIVDLAVGLGVECRTGAEVVAIERRGERATAVVLADGSRLDAEIIVADVDADHLYADLLPEPAALRRVRRAPRSTSGLVITAGVRGATPGLAHHNVWFSGDQRQEFRALEAGRLADDPTIYACVSSVTDPSQAPDGNENWFVLVNTPPDADGVTGGYADVVLDRLGEHGVDLRPRMVFHDITTPGDLARRHRNPGGAIYGTSSDGSRAAFVRPSNRGPIAGLYLVGGTAHPGGGLPLVMIGARIVADLIDEDDR